LFLLMLSFL